MAETTPGQQGTSKEPKSESVTSTSTVTQVQLGQGTKGKAVFLEQRRGPIVVRLQKKKRRYSRPLKELQKQLWRGTRAGDRLVDAVSAGLSRYRKRSNKSSIRKKDGLLKDFFKNSARGMGTTLRRSSTVPRILAVSINRRAIKRQVRLMRSLLGGR